LAAVLRDQDKYDLAEEIYRQELRLCETILGQDHPSTLTTTSNLPLVLRDQAEETYRQALGLIETVLGKDVEKAAGKRSLNHGQSSMNYVSHFDSSQEHTRPQKPKTASLPKILSRNYPK
jgi:hypothetical protein